MGKLSSRKSLEAASVYCGADSLDLHCVLRINWPFVLCLACTRPLDHLCLCTDLFWWLTRLTSEQIMKLTAEVNRAYSVLLAHPLCDESVRSSVSCKAVSVHIVIRLPRTHCVGGL